MLSQQHKIWNSIFNNDFSQVLYLFTTPDRQQSKTLILSTNIDQKLLETEFLIAICRPTDDKWQSKTLFLVIFDPFLSIIKSVLDCRLSCVLTMSDYFFSDLIYQCNLFINHVQLIRSVAINESPKILYSI